MLNAILLSVTILCIFKLIVAMLNVIIPTVIMQGYHHVLIVAMLNAIMLNVNVLKLAAPLFSCCLGEAPNVKAASRFSDIITRETQSKYKFELSAQ